MKEYIFKSMTRKTLEVYQEHFLIIEILILRMLMIFCLKSRRYCFSLLTLHPIWINPRWLALESM